MARLRQDMSDDAMVERVPVGGVEHSRRGRRGEAVEHHRDATEPCGHDRPGNGGKLMPTQPAQHVERVAGCWAVC